MMYIVCTCMCVSLCASLRARVCVSAFALCVLRGSVGVGVVCSLWVLLVWCVRCGCCCAGFVFGLAAPKKKELPLLFFTVIVNRQ